MVPEAIEVEVMGGSVYNEWERWLGGVGLSVGLAAIMEVCDSLTGSNGWPGIRRTEVTWS